MPHPFNCHQSASVIHRPESAENMRYPKILRLHFYFKENRRIRCINRLSDSALVITIDQRTYKRLSRVYSDLRLLTGFANAAFID
jgi:hypothetical protein